jgi:membrane-associated phospholipid phosphatase
MNFYKSIITFVILISCVSKVEAQKLSISKPTDSSSIGALLKYDSKIILRSVGNSFTRPLHWKKKDLKTFGTLLGGTLALYFIDEEANKYFSRIEPDVPNFIKKTGFYAGKPQNYFAATAAIYGFGLLTKNEKVRKTGVLIMSASVATGVFQSIMKTAVGRARPTEYIGNGSFKPFTNIAGFHSFPSGHTILSVTMAHAIAKQFDNTLTKVGIYTLGSIAPISRLLAGAHWLTDVVFSTAISIIIVDGVDKFLFNTKAYDYPTKEKLISWNLKFSSNQIGLVGVF